MMRIAIVDCLAHYKERVFPIVQALAQQRATAYLVGGCVRDMVLGLPLKDLDIEVHCIELAVLQQVLAQFGHVEEVGKKFGVLIVLGLAVDWSLPRSDSSGRKPQVVLQSHLDLKTALQRRDLTMNAMAINLTTVVANDQQQITEQEIIDPFGGMADIAVRRMRAVDDAFFVQDPLRMLRVMQFVGRFAMTPGPGLDALCGRMRLYDEYDNRPLARERIQAEVAKLLVQSDDPSQGFAWMVRIGRAAELFPFLGDEHAGQALQLMHEVAEKLDRSCPLEESLRDGVKTPPQGERGFRNSDFNSVRGECFQNVEDVAENVSNHTNGRLSGFARKILLLSAACWPSRQQSGCQPLRKVLANVTGAHDEVGAIESIIQSVKLCGVVRDDQAGVVTCKKIAAQLSRHASLRLVSYLVWCIYEPEVQSIENTALFSVAKRGGVLDAAEPPLVLGRDLLTWVAAGPQLGKLVARAYEVQLELGITDKDALIKRLQVKS